MLRKETQFLYCKNIDGNVNKNNFVNVSDSKVGKLLISDSFGPCQAVLAILKNGEYAIYHAASMGCSEPFQNFVNSIKNNVEIVFVFQKSNPSVNLQKAPYLVINLAKALEVKESGCMVKRVHVDDYTGIYANAETNEIVLFTYPNYTRKDNKTTKIQFDEAKTINYKPIGIKQSVNDLYHGLGEKGVFEINENRDVIINKTVLIIPSKFLSADCSFFQDEKTNISKNALQQNQNHKKKCTIL